MRLESTPKIDFNECFVPTFPVEDVSWRFSVDVYGFTCTTMTISTSNHQKLYQGNLIDVFKKDGGGDYYTNGYGYSFIELTVNLRKSKIYNLCPRFSFERKITYNQISSHNGDSIESEWESYYPKNRTEAGLVNVFLNNFPLECSIEEMADMGETYQYILNSCDLVNRTQFENRYGIYAKQNVT